MINCIAIDDEPLGLNLISVYIKKTPQLCLCGAFTDPFKAIDFLKETKIDLIFLDIEMPDLSGIQLLKSLPHSPMVIFTTAYSQYAVDGFNLDAIDYLLKPIEFDRFLRAVNKAIEFGQNSAPAPAPAVPSQDFIFVKSEYQLVKVNLNEILYIEGLDDYVKIYTSSKPILSLMSMKSMMQKLPLEQFIRVHRSFIVSVGKIESVQKNRIKIGDKLIPISDGYSDDFYRAIGGAG